MDAGATILAVSSPAGRSARGLIRLSGDCLKPHLSDLLDPFPPPRTLTPTRFRLHSSPTLQGGVTQDELTCPGLALFHPAPQSFTGQDVCELQVPGNPALLERILHVLLDHLPGLSGVPEARLAEAGEFTQRAFAAGRIDLTRAEGIAATVTAVCDAQLQAAGWLRRGRLGQWSEELVSALAEALARVEAGIDFIDQDDVIAITPADLDRRLEAIERQLTELTRQSRPWSALQALPWVVLAGPPNAGKSTLFNALLGHRRAVTGPVAGTTRDVLTEPLQLVTGDNTAEVMLVDLAGLARAEAELDRAMQDAAAEALRRAELVLLISDGSAPWIEVETAAPLLRVRTKVDAQPVPDDASCDLAVSAVAGTGLNSLRNRIEELMRQRAVSLGGQMLALQPRHEAAIRQTLRHLHEARRQIAGERDRPDLDQPELVAEPMRAALDALGELGGRMSPDDVIGQVFATFCVGK